MAVPGKSRETPGGGSDATRRFVIGPGAVRGEFVRLLESWRGMMERRPYPAPVASLLGECLAASALLTSTLKMLRSDGRLSLQIQGGQPVSLLVAECRADLTVRAMARFEGKEAAPADSSLSDLARGATFAVTIDPGGDYDSYQSLVPIEGATVAGALNAFMQRSEQIESHFALAANGDLCAGLLLQKLPTEDAVADRRQDPDLWQRVFTLAATLTREELLDLEGPEILHRLFHQEEVRLYPARPVSFVCRCSKDRIASMLKTLGADEIRGLLADRRTIEVDCDFCGQRFSFSAEEAWAALAG